MKHMRDVSRILQHWRTVMIAVAIFSMIASPVFSPYVYAVDKASQHVLTVYDGDEKIGILTNKATIDEALQDAGFELGEHDITEPSRNHALVEQAYDITLHRARPIAVHDGLYRTRIMSPYKTPQQIARQAKLDVHSEDIATLQVSEDILHDGALERLTITRAKTFFFDEFGVSKKVRTQADTVGDFLNEKGISLGKNEGTNMKMTDAIEVGTQLRVWRDGAQQITVEEAVPRPIREEKDATKEYGTQTIKKEGKDGKRSVVYEIELRNGKELSRKEIRSSIIEKPVEQVVVIGNKSRFVPYTGGGSKTEWLTAAGIPREMWGYADSIVTRESTWNPNARNPSSGACGLAQALPCSKVPGNPYNPVDSLRWMNGYVNGRYYDGSPYAAGLCSGAARGWECAYNFWQANHWY